MTIPPDDHRPITGTRRLDRRAFITIGASAGTVFLAGCSSTIDAPAGDDSTGSEPESSGVTPRSTGDTGTFRLLISDQPIAIDEFDSLTVTFEAARVFRTPDDDDAPTVEGSLDDESDDDAVNDTNTTEPPAEPNTPESDAETEDDDTDDEPADQTGFVTLDLDGAQVDLTEVIGTDALGVFEGDLEAGTYTKIELHATAVDGIIDGDAVEVKLPSGKLQIVKPFEVRPDETLSFVFDITVVRRGTTGKYNLLPVISESGVAGKDVPVTELNPDDDTETETEPADTNSTEE